MDARKKHREPNPEPTRADLAVIEREWPLIEAELALLDAEIRVLAAVGGPSVLDWRRLRRAQHQVLREAAALLAEPHATPAVAPAGIGAAA